ncbi:hypothetical protein RHSP_01122 [Rhizobium freirei PRF 81]|uniref:Uncharacterized protein n=1 Tax=Rhizobium freirei PRF 81 TaxID=363754 RepID=N6UG26_9HYPH|nr:hypothetical protein [Rhizobium freirei]ENN89113.1 hypothetical protein RHSP_01122 [Rhizobium freirei PRF 81]
MITNNSETRFYADINNIREDEDWVQVTISGEGAGKLTESQIERAFTSLPGEPVAWTTREQLQKVKDNPGANIIMWGEPLPYHPDIPLYAVAAPQPVSVKADTRTLAVEIVDGILGYTIEHSSDPDRQRAFYDLTEARIRPSLGSPVERGTEKDYERWAKEWHHTVEIMCTMLGISGSGSPDEILADAQIALSATSTCHTCDGTGKEGRHSICRDCDDLTAAPSPSTEIEALRVEILTQPFCVLFLDGRNEHGAHVLPSFPRSFDIVEDDVSEQADAILLEAERLGFIAGQDHVWVNFHFIPAQIGDEGRVELASYWDFACINIEMSKAINAPLRAALQQQGEGK